MERYQANGLARTRDTSRVATTSYREARQEKRFIILFEVKKQSQTIIWTNKEQIWIHSRLQQMFKLNNKHNKSVSTEKNLVLTGNMDIFFKFVQKPNCSVVYL